MIENNLLVVNIEVFLQFNSKEKHKKRAFQLE